MDIFFGMRWKVRWSVGVGGVGEKKCDVYSLG